MFAPVFLFLPHEDRFISLAITFFFIDLSTCRRCYTLTAVSLEVACKSTTRYRRAGKRERSENWSESKVRDGGGREGQGRSSAKEVVLISRGPCCLSNKSWVTPRRLLDSSKLHSRQLASATGSFLYSSVLPTYLRQENVYILPVFTISFTVITSTERTFIFNGTYFFAES